MQRHTCDQLHFKHNILLNWCELFQTDEEQTLPTVENAMTNVVIGPQCITMEPSPMGIWVDNTSLPTLVVAPPPLSPNILVTNPLPHIGHVMSDNTLGTNVIIEVCPPLHTTCELQLGVNIGDMVIPFIQGLFGLLDINLEESMRDTVGDL